MLTQNDIMFYELELSGDCNAECPLCERTRRKLPLRGNGNITLEQIKKLFPTPDLIKGRDIAFCGTIGDPILNPEMLEIAQYLDPHEPWVISLSTNGGYNTADWWRELGKIENLEVDFCIDGHEQTNHLYRVNVKWDILMRNLEAYLEGGGIARWLFIPFDHNEHEYETAKAHAERLGMKFVRKNSARNAMRNFANRKHTPRKTEQTIRLNNSTTLVDKDPVKVNEAVVAYDKKDKKVIEKAASTIFCRHLEKKHIFISSDFTVIPCCYLYRHQNQIALRYGYTDNKEWNNLNQYSVDEVLEKLDSFEIANRWDPEHKHHLQKCVTSCGNNGIALDKKIKEL